MTGSEVKALIGRPSEVTPMDSPTGKAEIWVYRRPLGSRIIQTAASAVDVPAFNGAATTMGTISQSQYRQETRTFEEETQLLMFNDQLVSSKRLVRGKASFN